jgi:hypothetical protein
MTKDSDNIKLKIKPLLIVFIDVTGVAMTLYIQPSLKLHGLSPRANYTDRAATACR